MRKLMGISGLHPEKVRHERELAEICARTARRSQASAATASGPAAAMAAVKRRRRP